MPITVLYGTTQYSAAGLIGSLVIQRFAAVLAELAAFDFI